jgi:steroid delta-isomerase-like uncharacterized protein
MSDTNKIIVKRLFDEVNKGKNSALAAIDELVAPDYVLHDPTVGEMKGKDSARQYMAGLFDAIPDLSFKLEDLLAEGDRAVYRFTYAGTHKGTLMGFPPTGKRVQATCISIGRLAGGKIAEEWQIWDTHGLFKQLAGEKVAARVA